MSSETDKLPRALYEKVRDVLKRPLHVPEYQRDYEWNEGLVRQLLNDLDEALAGNKEYRLGVFVLHVNSAEGSKEPIHDIVDGQQRLTTLSLIYYCLYQKDPNLQFSQRRSTSQLHSNYKIIQSFFESDSGRKDAFRKLFEEETKIELVVIEVGKISEAFQLYDTQNARGKDLDAVDILKAHHLRALDKDLKDRKAGIINMCSQGLIAPKEISEKVAEELLDNYSNLLLWKNDENRSLLGLPVSESTELNKESKKELSGLLDKVREDKQKKIVSKWEAGLCDDKQKNKIKELFDNYLYPIVNWSYQLRLYDRNELSKQDWIIFRGVSKAEQGKYNYANGVHENHFQILAPFKDGEQFFNYVSHYLDLKHNIESQDPDESNRDKPGVFHFVLRRDGNDVSVEEVYSHKLLWTRMLYHALKMAYADRFKLCGPKYLVDALKFSKEELEWIFRYSFSYRFSKKVVRFAGIDKHVADKEDGYKYKNPFWAIMISHTPSELFQRYRLKGRSLFTDEYECPGAIKEEENEDEKGGEEQEKSQGKEEPKYQLVFIPGEE